MYELKVDKPVKVYWPDETDMEATLRHIPCATGDSWVFETDDHIFYVTEPITVVQKKGD